MFGGFSGAEDDLREAPADLPVVVNAGKALILEGQMAKFLNRLIDIDLAVPDLFQ